MTDFNLDFLEMGTSGQREANPNPEFVVSCTKGKIKVNEAGSTLLDIKVGGQLILIHNFGKVQRDIQQGAEYIQEWVAEEEGREARNYPVSYFVAQGFTLGEGDDMKTYGCTMGNTNNKEGYAAIDGSSSADWAKLGGSKTHNVYFDIDKVSVGKYPVPVGNDEVVEVDLYKLLNPVKKEKIERTAGEAKDAPVATEATPVVEDVPMD